MLTTIDGLLIDLDGTVVTGKKLIPGADQAIEHFRKLGKKIVFVSNRGNISSQMAFDSLTALGVKLYREEILLASTVTARFLQAHYPTSRVWTLGDDGLSQELQYHSVKLATRPQEADFLVVSLHEAITYADLNAAFQAVRNGARIIATNADKMFPSEGGDSIDVAAMIGAIEAATDKKTELVIGKLPALWRKQHSKSCSSKPSNV